MKTITPYDPETGRFGAVLTVPDSAIARLRDFKHGRFDKRSQRVDVVTGEVVAYERPAAEIDAEQRDALRRQARQRIDELERSQLRPMRELAIDPNDAEAKRRLAEIDQKIAAQRADLSGNEGG